MQFPEEALERLKKLLERAKKSDLPEPTAMTLATSDRQGNPMARTVLLKDVDEQGVVFYTNLNSRKGRQLSDNPKAAICFYWPPLSEQVLIEGNVTPVTDEEADAYWASRARESQIGGWASRQSETLPHRFALLRRVISRTARFGTAPVPRPEFWSGFRVDPHRIEFWSNRPSRLHDRVCYEVMEGNWTKRRLFP
ncbi:MAG: pyridoxamine 5'-phosphate oxidase [Gammaproteobacteria bacterium]|nr:pyridoxamine 5'-phosphate oxidase [Gammaproteobacteria bacterium]